MLQAQTGPLMSGPMMSNVGEKAPQFFETPSGQVGQIAAPQQRLRPQGAAINALSSASVEAVALSGCY
jgi:hypothetical protein